MKFLTVLLLGVFLISCQSQKARRPVETKTGSFIKNSIKRNKKLVAKEEEIIQKIMEKDSAHNYLSSKNGFWYFYNKELKGDSLKRPEKGDMVTYEYDISTLNGKTIYSRSEMGKRQFKMDKEVVFSGLRLALKLMKEGETATFLFPSDLAFGYYGDSEKIGRNTPIRSTITLQQIKPETDSIHVQSR